MRSLQASTIFRQISSHPLLLAAAVLLVAGVGLGACASQKAADSDPDDMSVEEHRLAAEQEREEAEEHREEYDPNATKDPNAVDMSDGPGEPSFYNTATYNPTEEHLQEAKKHERHAEQHARAAQTLLEFKNEHCAKFPEKVRRQCPLMGQVEAVEEVEGGAKLTIAEDVNLDAITDHMRCHFAFGKTKDEEGMETCPLYLEKLSFEQVDADHAVIIRTQKAENVPKVRERSRGHLE